jgi:hypothetical protein
MQRTDRSTLMTHVVDCGTQLRSDDPSALKEIILQAQEKHKQKDEEAKRRADNNLHSEDEGNKEFDARIRYMLEMIYDLKNNRVRSKGAATQSDTSISRLLAIINDIKPSSMSQ